MLGNVCYVNVLPDPKVKTECISARQYQRPGPDREQHLDQQVPAEEEDYGKTCQEIGCIEQHAGSMLADREPDEKIPDAGKGHDERVRIPGNDPRQRACIRHMQEYFRRCIISLVLSPAKKKRARGTEPSSRTAS